MPLSNISYIKATYKQKWNESTVGSPQLEDLKYFRILEMEIILEIIEQIVSVYK